MPVLTQPILELQQALAQGRTTAKALTKKALARAQDPQGEGHRVFLQLHEQEALIAADISDTLRAAGQARSHLEGIPVSIKDVFDMAGEQTLGGSRVLADTPPAAENALVVQRLINAGAIIVGRTNMDEFGFSGLGINPHYGTPRAPWNRTHGHLPGGSSSGAGVSVAEGMSAAGIGTDTGGSVRIPAAFCGVTGFKPTAERIPGLGTLPLSFSLDSIGALGSSVRCCAIVDSVLAATPHIPLTPIEYHHLRIAVPKDVVFNGLDQQVSQRINATILALTNRGAQIERIELPELNQLAYINREGGFSCAEAWALHRELMHTQVSAYDPHVAYKISLGRHQSAADYIDLLADREEWIAAVSARLSPYDAFLMPTVPIVPPRIDAITNDEQFYTHDALILRNSSIVNFLDGCAISLPCHPEGEAPVGLTLASTAHNDQHLLRVAYTVEQLLKQIRS